MHVSFYHRHFVRAMFSATDVDCLCACSVFWYYGWAGPVFWSCGVMMCLCQLWCWVSTADDDMWRRWCAGTFHRLLDYGVGCAAAIWLYRPRCIVIVVKCALPWRCWIIGIAIVNCFSMLAWWGTATSVGVRVERLDVVHSFGGCVVLFFRTVYRNGQFSSSFQFKFPFQKF